MEKIALITDSTCGLPQAYIDEYDVHILRLKVIYKDKEYVDGIDITPEEVYARLDEELPTTSMPSAQEAEELFEKLIDEGYTHAIVLPISSGLSGTINSFKIAAERYEKQMKIFIFDTKILSMAVGLSVIEIGKGIKSGRSFEELCLEVPKLRERTEMYFTVDTLEYLIKGGRIGRVSGSIGELLNIKPIIMMNEEGKYTTFTKVRGSKQAVNKLVELGTEILNQTKGKVIIMTGTMLREAELLKETFANHINTTFLHVGTITPVVGIHSGPRLLAVAVMRD